VKDRTKGVVTVAVLLAPLAQAQSQGMLVEVPVTGVQPLVRVITHKIPHESCWDERVKVVREGGGHSATPGVLGAVVGGVVAGSMGHNSRYQPVIAGAGAVLGASIGHDISHSRNSDSYYVTEQRCEVDYELRDEEKIIGYRVSYEYGGNVYHTETRNPPGPTIQLQVNVTPVTL
jgi:uncharacterized protein YcfJ